VQPGRGRRTPGVREIRPRTRMRVGRGHHDASGRQRPSFRAQVLAKNG